jgi:hypothetical protein
MVGDLTQDQRTEHDDRDVRDQRRQRDPRARTEAAAQRAIADVQAAYTIADTAPAANPIVYRTIRP